LKTNEISLEVEATPTILKVTMQLGKLKTPLSVHNRFNEMGCSKDIKIIG